ncbi:zinc knuckle CX2CX4HX4C containing protein [Tanacetum coccineum]
MFMAVQNLVGLGYTKETIRVEYEWELSRCSTCLIFGHSVNDCLKAPKRMVIGVDNGKGGSSGADDDGNGTFSPSNSFEALNGDNPVTEEIDSGNKAFMSVDDEGKPLKKVKYSGDHDSKDKVEPVDNEMTSFLALKASGVGYATNSLLEQ